MAGSTAVFVMAADRGHFTWSVPLAEALVLPGVLHADAKPVVEKVEQLGWTPSELRALLELDEDPGPELDTEDSLPEDDFRRRSEVRHPVEDSSPPGPDSAREPPESELPTDDPSVAMTEYEWPSGPGSELSTSSRRRRRRNRTTAQDSNSEQVGQPSPSRLPMPSTLPIPSRAGKGDGKSSEESELLKVLRQLLDDRRSDKASQGSWDSRRGPAPGMKWKGGTPPNPPRWNYAASDIRAFSKWERRVRVWQLQVQNQLSGGKGGKSFHPRKVYQTETLEEGNEEDEPDQSPEADEEYFEPETFDEQAADPSPSAETEPADEDELGSFLNELATVLTVTSNKLRAATLGRKFTGRKSIEERKRTSSCSACGTMGHWTGDPECPLSAGGKGRKGKGDHKGSSAAASSTSTSGPKRTFMVSYGDEAVEDDNAAYFNFPTNHVPDSMNAPFVYVTESIDLAGYMVLDTACQRSCTGSRWLNTHLRILENYGLSCHRVLCDEQFQFGAGACQTAHERCYLPAAFASQETQGILLGVSVVADVNIPFLASRVLMQQLGCVIDMHQNVLCFSNIGVTVPLLHKHGHLVASIVAFPPRAAQLNCWSELESRVFLEKPHPECIVHEALTAQDRCSSTFTAVHALAAHQAAAVMAGELEGVPPEAPHDRAQCAQGHAQACEHRVTPKSMVEQHRIGRPHGEATTRVAPASSTGSSALPIQYRLTEEEIFATGLTKEELDEAMYMGNLHQYDSDNPDGYPSDMESWDWRVHYEDGTFETITYDWRDHHHTQLKQPWTGHTTFMTQNVHNQSQSLLTASARRALRNTVRQTHHVYNLEYALVAHTADEQTLQQQQKHLRGSRPKVDILETFAGQANITKRSSSFRLSAAQPVDYATGWDLNNTSHQADLEDMLDSLRPLVLIQGIDCRDWSILQDNTNYIRRKILLLMRRAKARKLLKKVTSWCHKQAEAGRLFLLENPTTSRLWQEDAIKKLEGLPNVSSTTCHAGAYGAVNSQGQMIRKGHRFMGNCPHVLKRLGRHLSAEEQRRCVPLQGRETTLSQHYPHQMVTEILKGVQDEVRARFPDRFQPRPKVYSSYMVTSPDQWHEALQMAEATFQVTRYKTFTLPASDPLFALTRRLTQWSHMERVQIALQPIMWRFPWHVPHTHRAAALQYNDGEVQIIEEDFSELRHPKARFKKPVQLAIFMFGQGQPDAERPRDQASASHEAAQPPPSENDPRKLVPPPPGEEISFPLELKIPAEIKNAIRRMHQNLGHPKPAELKKLLALNGVNNQAIYTAVEHLRCNSCERTKGPSRPDLGAIPAEDGCSQFGDRLQMDIFYVRDVTGQNFMVLGIIDEVTHLHLAALLDNRQAETVLAAFNDTWAKAFGYPLRIRLDPDCSFRSHFEDDLDQAGVFIDYVPAEAHNKIGLIERHNAVFRSLMERIIDYRAITGREQMYYTTTAAAFAKNSCTWSAGRPPYVAAFGRIPRMGIELLSDPHGLVTGQTRAQAQQMDLRVASQNLHDNQLQDERIPEPPVDPDQPLGFDGMDPAEEIPPSAVPLLAQPPTAASAAAPAEQAEEAVQTDPYQETRNTQIEINVHSPTYRQTVIQAQAQPSTPFGMTAAQWMEPSVNAPVRKKHRSRTPARGRHASTLADASRPALQDQQDPLALTPATPFVPHQSRAEASATTPGQQAEVIDVDNLPDTPQPAEHLEHVVPSTPPDLAQDNRQSSKRSSTEMAPPLSEQAPPAPLGYKALLAKHTQPRQIGQNTFHLKGYNRIAKAATQAEPSLLVWARLDTNSNSLQTTHLSGPPKGHIKRRRVLTYPQGSIVWDAPYEDDQTGRRISPEYTTLVTELWHEHYAPHPLDSLEVTPDGIQQREQHHDGSDHISMPYSCHTALQAYRKAPGYNGTGESSDSEASADDMTTGHRGNSSLPTTAAARSLTRQEQKALDKEVPWQAILQMDQDSITKYVESAKAEEASWQQFDSVIPLTAQEANKVVEIFTRLSSAGDSDEEGEQALEAHFESQLREAQLGATLAEAFEKMTVSQEVQERLQKRLSHGDVFVVVYEQVWCSWVEALAKKAEVPCISFQPSYIDVFRQSANLPCRSFQSGLDFGPEGMVYTLASCLRTGAPVPAGRRAVGAILPLPQSRLRLQHDDIEKDLRSWLEKDPDRPVVYCSLGSHMLARVLDPGSITRLLKGILEASCRALFVLNKAAREFADSDPGFDTVSTSGCASRSLGESAGRPGTSLNVGVPHPLRCQFCARGLSVRDAHGGGALLRRPALQCAGVGGGEGGAAHPKAPGAGGRGRCSCHRHAVVGRQGSSRCIGQCGAAGGGRAQGRAAGGTVQGRCCLQSAEAVLTMIHVYSCPDPSGIT
ncbi:Pentatricopeptide repeat-containing protein [Durusdinium trenchii]|uniref:Mitochondrial n=1 Tax=Durusdinium trenchii TaxID=1381693 RepID=A0ABP0KVB7_9DINO